jgi:putative ABC transport system permease protein
VIDRLRQDVRYALYQAARAPGFACVVVTTLALTIGANTALFSLVNALVLRTLPVRNPGELVLLQATDDRGQQNRPLYYSTFSELAALPVFDSLALYSGGGFFQIEARGALNEGLIEASTPGLFEALGLQPHLGRFFTADDSPADRPAAAVVVLSYDFWRRAFGRDPKVVGETILISGTPAVVIGVTPPGYKGLYVDGGYGFSVPLTFLTRQMSANPERPVRGLNAVARLAAGVPLTQARAAVEAVWPTLRVRSVPPGLSQTEQKEIPTQRIKVESLATGFSSLRRQYQRPLMLLWAITALLLLVGCVNFSGLLLARAAAREQQLAICFALGASRGRIIQQLLTESLLLSLIGAAVALPLAWWGTKAAGTVLWESSAPLAQSLTPDARVLALTAAIAIATGLVIGMLPAYSASRDRPRAGLRLDATVSHMSSRWGKSLLVAQIAMSLMLLVGAGLFASSLVKLRNLDDGIRTDGVRWSRLFAVPNGYRNQNDAAYYPELVRQLSGVQGVHSVALASYFPTYFGLGNAVPTQPLARAEATDPAQAAAGFMENVTPRFFETVGITLLRGRDFAWSDDAQHPEVAIINESLNRQLFQDGDAIGRRLRIGNDPRRAAVEIVGVVSDAAIVNYKLPHMPVAFRPRTQELQLSRAPVMVFRMSADPAVVDKAMERVIAGLGHEYPRRFSSLDEQIDLSLLQERLLAALSSFFAGLAVLIAFVGLYGMLAYAVARRTREIGVRMALGASRNRLIRMIVSDAVRLTLLSVAIGVSCSLAAGSLIGSFLFGLGPADPATFIGASALFVLVGAVAGLRPALRASSVDPMAALRAD